MILVIAGSYDQFRNLLRERNIPYDRTAINYACMSEHIQGIKADVIFYGTYWENPLSSSDLLNHLLRIGQLKTIEIGKGELFNFTKMVKYPHEDWI